jgi:murein DD-endopeptidase MepM/ murein hydrolase activator NlpD
MHNKTFLTGLTSGFTPVVDAGYSLEQYIFIDLSKSNGQLSQKELDAPEAFQDFLDEYLQKENRKVAYGGYNELRGLYRRSDLFAATEEDELARNIHIGLDLWVPEGTAVLAVLPGRIHSFQDNDNFGDYGPTIILEHQHEQHKFYSLYGHLQKSSLEGLTVGAEVMQGQKIAALGGPMENGNYAAHLHFQIILDMEGKTGDYPGVASRLEIEHYLKNCPDPNLLLKIR